jgi:phosphatidylglycerophosphatase A
MRAVAVFLATFGYTGLFPFAPGTIGSLAGLLVYAAIMRSGGGAVAELVTIAVLLGGGVWAGTIAEHHFGGEDPGPVIVDEVAGMLITVLLVPVSATGAVAGFVIFRVFDILKPFPASRLERLHGGWGVMADDVMAAVYGNLTLRLLWWLIPQWIV